MPNFTRVLSDTRYGPWITSISTGLATLGLNFGLRWLVMLP